MFRRLLARAAVLLIACAALLGTAAQPAWAGSSPPQPPRFPSKPTEVVIIGTMHSAQLEFEEHSPARIRALLNRIDPVAVGIETRPEWYAEDIFFEIAYESYGVAVPWAREKGREVRPVDWQAPEPEFASALAWPRVAPESADTGEEETPESARDPLAEWDVPPLLFADTPEWRDAINQAYANADASPDPYGEAIRRYMLYRNLMIAREIVNMAADHEGRRVAVLIGAAHKPDLDLFLATVPNIVIRHASEWDGVTEAEVEAEERPADHLAILWYNLAGSRRINPEVLDLARMDRLLAGLEKARPRDPEVRFLRARWHQARGETARAVAIYRSLAWTAQWADRPFTFPDRALSHRVAEWYSANPPWGEPMDLGLDNVFSPVANLTIRQRVLYELAVQEHDQAARRRARTELAAEPLNARQRQQLQQLLEAPAAEHRSRPRLQVLPAGVERAGRDWARGCRKS